MPVRSPESTGRPDAASSTRFRLRRARCECPGRGKKPFGFASLPDSHFLIVSPPDKETADAIVRGGFTRIKLKAGKDLDSLVSQLAYWDAELPARIRWRLDFNGVLNSELFTRFLDLTERFHERIDFIEDPFFAVEDWRALPLHSFSRSPAIARP